MKKYLIAIAALASISGAALAAPGEGNGESRHSADDFQFSSPASDFAPVNADVETLAVEQAPALVIDSREQRRIDEKNGD